MVSHRLYCVGKLKSHELLKLESDYLKRLPKNYLIIEELKSKADDPSFENKLIQQTISGLKKTNRNILIVLLSEDGKSFSTREFFQDYFLPIQNEARPMAFFIGGAVGLSDATKKMGDLNLCLGKFTFPHRLARLIIIEQIYRLHTLFEGHPYHND